jgi:hypothetical protein
MYETVIICTSAKYFYIILGTAISHDKFKLFIKNPSILQRKMLFIYLI